LTLGTDAISCLTLKNVLEQMPIIIQPDELIVGNPASHPYGLEIEAGLGKWDKDEVDALRADGYKLDEKDEIEMLSMNEQFKPFGMYDENPSVGPSIG
jgi:hypothetical protein